MDKPYSVGQHATHAHLDSSCMGGGFAWQRPVGGGGWQVSKPPLQRHTRVLFFRLHSLPSGQSLSDMHTPVGKPADKQSIRGLRSGGGPDTGVLQRHG